MNRRKLLKTCAFTTLASTSLSSMASVKSTYEKKESVKASTSAFPLAITMWEFSWLERRWPGAGYENWDIALSELVERGYDAVRIDPFPHLIYHDLYREYTLLPAWNTQCWGSPAINKVKVEPHLTDFIRKCKEYNIKVALSSWWREDEEKLYNVIQSPAKFAEVWLSVLNLLNENQLLDQIIYLDLSNEWPISVWTPFKPNIGSWDSALSIEWMRESIKVLREKYPEIPYTYSFTGEVNQHTPERGDLSMLDFIEPHIWMTSFNNNEFYKKVPYHYERFDDIGYKNLAMNGKKLFDENPDYWKKGLVTQIQYAAQWSDKWKLPLITTECWGVVDYKDWPLLDWDWVKELCAIGVEEAAKTGKWLAIATSNFCGPQFVGMWKDVEWHKRLTSIIHQSKVSEDIKNSILGKRILNRL